MGYGVLGIYERKTKDIIIQKRKKRNVILCPMPSRYCVCMVFVRELFEGVAALFLYVLGRCQ